MEKSLARPQKCVVIRGGFEIWVDVEKANRLQMELENLKTHLFITWGKDQFNTADVTGIFSPETMDERTRRKNGQWQCQAGSWHDRFEKCACGSREQREWNIALAKAIIDCGECSGGFIPTERGMARHKCTGGFFRPDGKPDYAYTGENGPGHK